ncbi:hypothetical protein GCM10009117_07690 [Gangjinia marincola]|uniref:GmrSD restriction endonucleases N-terminal domain-containing protein n=1 Tax=Gangjinia marincola TaxID=578463 RepID=A0ABN1MER8_9FLAO
MNNLITIQKTFYKIADFISWKKKGGLLLSPHFQRRAVWNKGAKSYLIDTIYKGLPVPIIFLRDRGINKENYEPMREVIDGQQRLRTIIAYIAPDLLDDFDPKVDDFVVKKTHNSELAGTKFKNLDEDAKNRILNYEFNVHILSSNVDDRDVIQIFRRMNSTSYSLKKQELLNSQYFGEFKTSLYDLAAEQLNHWRKWKTFTDVDISRMQEVELASELIISMMEKKIQGKSTSQIESYYKKYDEEFKEREILENRFRTVIEYINDNFPGNKNDFVFYKKTIFYTFFMSIYHLLYGIKSDVDKKTKAKKIDNKKLQEIKAKGDRIANRSAPDKVLEATDRRTTNPKERNILFDYLIS